jgi:hypothetical protein
MTFGVLATQGIEGSVIIATAGDDYVATFTPGAGHPEPGGQRLAVPRFLQEIGIRPARVGTMDDLRAEGRAFLPVVFLTAEQRRLFSA